MIGRGLGIWLLLTGFALAQFSMQSYVDRQSLRLDETLEYTIEVHSDQQLNLPNMQLPSMADFQIMGSSRVSRMQIGNGGMDNSTEFRYTLMPQREGALTIPAIGFRLQGKDYSTQLIRVQVGQGVQNPGSAAGKSTAIQTERPDLFITSQTDKPSYYAGEPILITIKFYNRLKLFNRTQIQNPEVQNATAIKNAAPTQKEYTERVGSKQYNVFEVVFPYISDSPGQVKINPVSAVYSVHPFEPNREARSEPLTVAIKPLPGKGDSQSLGRFTLKAELSKAHLEENEGAYLRINISGTGSLRMAAVKPPGTIPDLDVMEPETKYEQQFVDGRLQSTKKFEYLIIPRHAGTYKLPAFSFSYFDSQDQAYRTLTSEVQQLKVSRSSKQAVQVSSNEGESLGSELQLEKDDIRYIRTRVGPSYHWQSLFLYIFSALVLLALLILAFIFPLMIKIGSAVVSGLYRSDEVRLLRLCGKPASKDVLEHIHRQLLRTISHRLNCAPSSVDRGLLERSFGLVDNGKEFIAFMDQLERIRFSPTSEQSLHELQKAAIPWLRFIQREGRS